MRHRLARSRDHATAQQIVSNTNRFTQPPLVGLFDVDGCLISTGGAGAKAWRYAIERLHGVPADIGQFTEAGMTDPEVGR